MRLRYSTWTYRPPYRVSCQLVSAEPLDPYEGVYVDGQWIFDIEEDVQFSAYKLVLDNQVSSKPFLPSEPVLTTDPEEFAALPIRAERGFLQRWWFAEGQDLDLWDVIVVGTGMGGGVLQYRLASEYPQFRVLGLEAGSLLLPTHVSNLPRIVYPPSGEGATTLWNTYQQLGTQPYQYPQEWYGRELFALGGRSLMWGGLAPRISDTELDAHWPNSLVKALTSGPSYYRAAEDLLSVQGRYGSFEHVAVARLNKLLPNRHNHPAPVAVETESKSSWRLPTGMFSTASLLLEARLASPVAGDGFGQPFVHLGELVTKVEREYLSDGSGSHVWRVYGARIDSGDAVVHRARAVVICAGAIESTRIMQASEVGMDPKAQSLVGKGLTEHPMYFLHFEVPATSRPAGGSVKVLSEPGTSQDDWNLLLELNSDLVGGRILPVPLHREETEVSDGYVAAQLVFMGRASLGDGSVERSNNPWLSLPHRANDLHDITLRVKPVPVAAGLVETWQHAARDIVAAFGGRPLPKSTNQNLDLMQAHLGFVAHEVGTLRMSQDSQGVVDENLQVYGCERLFVCDNSVFPTSPAANPSLTLAALALRLADELAVRLSS